MKLCQSCGQLKPLDAFGIARHRLSGRNIYCKPCCVRQQTEVRARRLAKEQARAALGLPRIVRKPGQRAVPIWRLRLGANDAVLAAVQRGARTQEEMKVMTRLHPDVISDSLAELILERGEVKWDRNKRIYLAA